MLKCSKKILEIRKLRKLSVVIADCCFFKRNKIPYPTRIRHCVCCPKITRFPIKKGTLRYITGGNLYRFVPKFEDFFVANRIFFLKNFPGYYICMFILRCLCFGGLLALPFAVKAEVIKVSFDAKDYQKAEDWPDFLRALCKNIQEDPHWKVFCEKAKKDPCFNFTLDLSITNGGIFGTEAKNIFDCFSDKQEPGNIGKVLDKVSTLRVATPAFSGSLFGKPFRCAKQFILGNTQKIEGEIPKNDLSLMIERTVDAKGLNFKQLVNCICETFKKYPDDKCIRFSLDIKNGDDIFSKAPGELNFKDYFNEKKEPTGIAKIFSKISELSVDTKKFTTLFLWKVFPWIHTLRLPKCTNIFLACTCEDYTCDDYDTLCKRNFDEIQKLWENRKNEKSCCLRYVEAPNVTTIWDAAFFRFENLQYFNSDIPSDSEPPAIVCTTLPKDYFEKESAPENTRIAIRGRKYEGIEDKRSMWIGSCAFQNCFALEHISARVHHLGNSAFPGSGLKSVHLLLASPEEKDESIDLGSDVFFNCFRLKEFFAISDGAVKTNGSYCGFRGFFWNCFSLETVCMPSVLFSKEIPYLRRFEEEMPFGEVRYTMFKNCFSLKELDMRCFKHSIRRLLPYWIESRKIDTGGIQDYMSEVALRFVPKEPDESLMKGFPKHIQKYIRLVLETSDNEPLRFLQGSGSEIKKLEKDRVFKKPYCDIDCFIFSGKKGMPFDRYYNTKVEPYIDNSKVSTIAERNRPRIRVGKRLFGGIVFEGRKAFSRFDDACSQWFREKRREKRNVRRPGVYTMLKKKRKISDGMKTGDNLFEEKKNHKKEKLQNNEMSEMDIEKEKQKPGV